MRNESVLLVKELPDPDDTFDLGRRTAVREKQTVIITRHKGNQQIPVMEFDSNGRYNEVMAPRLRASIANMQIDRMVEVQVSMNLGCRVSQRQKRQAMAQVAMLKSFESRGGRI